MIIFDGTISTKSVLENDKRECVALYFNNEKKSKDIRYIASLAKRKGVHCISVPSEKLDKLAGHKRHGGIVLQAKEREFPVLENEIKEPFFFISGIEDPYHLGSSCRSLVAMGIQTLVLRKRQWHQSEAIIQKSSAGAYEKMNIVTIEEDEELVKYCQGMNIPILCAHRKDAIPLKEVRWPQAFCLAVGGALRGLSSVVVNASTTNVMIPYHSSFRNALDTQSAISILAYEWSRDYENK